MERGSNIGPYHLVASLGRGGQADVFLAVRRGLAGFSKLMVIKSIRPDLEDEPRFREALIIEARLAARLQHPNVVQTLEVGDHQGQVYLAMEFLDGQPLDRVVQRAGTRIGAAQAAAILSGMLSGLHCAHDLCDYDGQPLRIVHRDVSPQNVFLTYEGEIKIVDFGIAKTAFPAEATEIGVIKGKAAYLAPEQALGQPVDRRADVYAAGIVAWELFSGKRLFGGDAPSATSEMRLSGQVLSLGAVAPGLPPALVAVVDKALARLPDQRYATAREMREALDAAVADAGIRPSSREEIGALVAGLFDMQRKWLQERIRKSLAAAENETPSEHTPAPLPDLRSQTPMTPSSVGQTRESRLPRKRALLLAAGTGGLVAVLSIGLWTLKPRLWPAAPALRLCGSNTIGASLAPALVEAFLRRKGPAPIEHRAGEDGKRLIAAGALSATIDAEGTATAFTGFAAGRCDIGMTSRPMNDAERASLAAKGIGELRMPATEHVIALDGIAVIVHPNNPVASLSIAQVRSIFTGEIADWSELGGVPGPIKVNVRDGNSGTYDAFQHLVLGKAKLLPGLAHFSDSIQLSDQVGADPSAIGFIGFPYLRSARALAIAEEGAQPLLPSPFTVADESYPLARRLYLYTLPAPRAPLIAELVQFVLSSDGQRVVRETGFIDLSIGTRSQGSCDARCPPAYLAAIQGAKRLTVDFRFRPEGGLDSRATRDLDRLVAWLNSSPTSRLLLLGFADVASAAGGQTISLEEARSVAAELERRGIRPQLIEGFGAAMPLSSSNDPEGRQRNRRVEVWVRDGS